MTISTQPISSSRMEAEPTSNNLLTQTKHLLIRRSVMQVHVFKSNSIGWINSGYDSYEGKLDAS